MKIEPQQEKPARGVQGGIVLPCRGAKVTRRDEANLMDFLIPPYIRIYMLYV